MDTIPGRHVGHADCLVALEDNTGHTCICAEIQIILDVHDAVDIGYQGSEEWTRVK